MKTGKELIFEIDNYESKKDEIMFWWIGQHGFIIKFGSKVVYIDPYLSNKLDRKYPSLLKAEEINNADLIIGSHDHLDHIDRECWPSLSCASPESKFIIPKFLIQTLPAELQIDASRFIGIDDSESIEISGIKITGIAAAHEFLDRSTITGCFPYLGYVIEANGCVIYHSGDTCIYEGFESKLKKWKRIDVMFLPINGRDAKRFRIGCMGNMTYQEAADLAGTVEPKLVVAAHYEMFKINMGNPRLFAEYLQAKYPDQKFWIGRHNQGVLVK